MKRDNSLWLWVGRWSRLSDGRLSEIDQIENTDNIRGMMYMVFNDDEGRHSTGIL